MNQYFNTFNIQKGISLFLFSFLFLAIAYNVYPSNLTGNDILKKVDETMDYKTSLSQTAMVIYPDYKNDPNTKRVIGMVSYSQGTENIYTQYTYPNSIKGMEMLTRGDDIWMFFPDSGQVKKVASYNKKKSVEGVGGDFSYQDMSMGDFAEDYTAAISSETNKEWVLILTPIDEDNAYKKLEATVEKNRFRITKVNYYDEDGYMKTLFLTGYKTINNYDTPMTMTMVNGRSSSKTVVSTVKIQFDVAVDESYFNSNRLGKH